MQIIGIFTALVIIGIIILIHEFGHYIVGKLSGCSVSKFSIGWGPKLFSFKRRETEYIISYLPFIGGYVRMPGMEGENLEFTDEEKNDIKKYNLKTFEGIRTWQKFLVFVGGVGMQAIVCAIILTFVISMMGKPLTKVMIAKVSENSPAQIAGLVGGDIILEADGKNMNSTEELMNFIADKSDKTILLTVDREKKIKTFRVTPHYSKEAKRALMGINIAPTLYFEKRDMGWYDYTFGGIVFTGKLSLQILQGIWKLITNQLSLKTSAMGPVRIVAITKEILKTGFLQLILFFAIININLAIINSLPVPALDGGHVLILSIEKLFRIRIKPKIKEFVTTVGFVLLMILISYVIYNDIVSLISSR